MERLHFFFFFFQFYFINALISFPIFKTERERDRNKCSIHSLIRLLKNKYEMRVGERQKHFGGRNNLEIGFASLITDFTLIQIYSVSFPIYSIQSRHTNKETKKTQEKIIPTQSKFERSAIHFQFQCLRNFIYYIDAMKRENLFAKNRVTSL